MDEIEAKEDGHAEEEHKVKAKEWMLELDNQKKGQRGGEKTGTTTKDTEHGQKENE